MYSGSKLTPRVDATFEIAIAIFSACQSADAKEQIAIRACPN
jgi:hypothetical protein